MTRPGASESARKAPSDSIVPAIHPCMLDPIDVTRDGTNDAWIYRGKDSATGADVAVHLTREPCSRPMQPAPSTPFAPSRSTRRSAR